MQLRKHTFGMHVTHNGEYSELQEIIFAITGNYLLEKIRQKAYKSTKKKKYSI